MPIGNDLLFCTECEPENSDHSWSAARETPSNEVTRVCWQYWANFAYNWVYAGVIAAIPMMVIATLAISPKVGSVVGIFFGAIIGFGFATIELFQSE